MKLPIFSFLLLAFAAVRPVQAQSSTVASVPASAVAPKHLQAALDLLNEVYPADSFNKLIDQILEAQLKQHAELKQVEPEMRAFFTKYMGWETLRPDLAVVYTREFTEPELREITRIYQTPIGRKMLTSLPRLVQSGMEIGQSRVQEHLPELQQMIKDKLGAEKQ
ncbi:MAG: DUF2059 domain-containing protein [Janthinobacterium lividum]